MAEHHQPQHPRRQQPLAAVTQKLRDFLSERGPSTAEVLAFVTVVPVGGFLILLAGLTLAGTLIGLAVTAPLFVLFSPVLVPAALTIGFAVAGFLTSVALGVTALCSFTWTANYLRRMRERNTISGGQHEDPGASSSSTSPERSDSGGPHEDAGVSRSSTSPERSDSGPPASSTSPIGDDYCVFLSFRGSDTRNGFADHLYRRLKGVGLRFDPNFVFRDDEKLLFGKDIGANLISAITNSKVSIPVISPNYASSEWCLRELIHIMECKENRGQIVLPVLYNVEPKDVKCLLGSFGKAFQSLEHCLDEEFKQKGRQALIKAADLRVFESRKFANGHEAELVDKLVALVMRQQQEVFQPCLHKNLVGIDDHVAEVMKLVDIAYPNTRIIGLYGMGGIGKTTLATVIYNILFEKFECHSFLMDIRETIICRSIEHVQSQLISDILKFPDYQVHDSYTGIRIIQSNFKEKKVLILLDDVDKKDVLKKLIGDCNFMSGSRIIVTCRDKAILESKYEYELKEMNIKDSRCLFGIYAFEGKPPPPELANLSREIVATTGGLPLALMVIGSLLKGEEDQRVWREMRKKLGKAPNMTVQQKLRISYDMLEPKEQQIFLDIACFFIGTDKRIAIYLWDDLELYPLSALAKMTQRMLIKCDDNNEFGMHDQLRDLGKAIARPADKKPWDYSRLWDEAAMTTLVHKEENENIEALLLDMNGSSKFMEQESFKRMPNLKVLHSSAVGFAGDFEESLSELRWLKWEGCPDSFEAANVHFKKLLILDLFRGNISENWGGWSSIKMERLKVLNLTWCSNLKSTPNLAAFKSLEMLILENCRYLERIDPSIGDVKCLVSLNLRYCGSLKKLPAQLGQLKELEELLIDETGIREIPECITFLNKLKTLSVEGCHRLTKVPSALGHLVKLPIKKLSFLNSMGFMARRLMTLDLSDTCIEELPECIEKLKNLKYLTISRSKIRKLPSAIGKLRGLQMLDASGCQKLEGQIPVDFGGLFSLRTLCLCRTKISSLPKNFHELYTLEHLNLLHCGELQSLPIPPSGLLTLQLTCRSNMLPSFSHLSLLKELTLHSCVSLISIPVLPSCIQKLCIRKCPELKSLPNFSNLKSLLELVLSQCYGLMEFHGLKALESLRKLDISRNTELSNLDNFEDLELLTNLEMQADNLHEIGGLCELRSLEVLNISGRKHVQRLDLSKSEHLKQLVVNDCESLVEICCHDRTELEHFEWKGCKSLKKLPNGLANCKL